LYVLGERLGAKLESFDHGQVGEQLLRQFLNGHPRPDRQHGCLNQFAGMWRHRLYTDQPATARLRDQFDEAARIEIGQRARHVVQRQRAAVGFDSLELR